MKSVRNFSVNKKRNNWLNIFIGVVALVILLWILNVFVSPVKNFFYTISSPVQKVFWSAGESSSNFLGSILDSGNLMKENNGLKQQNEKLLSQIASLQSIEQGNQAQSDVSAACQNAGFKVVMAGVIGLDSNDTLSINKGSADGISEGMPVIGQQNVLFGKVLKVYNNFSKVLLVSNKSSVVNVKIQQDGSSDPLGSALAPEIDGVVKGSGGLSAYLDLIPINTTIKSGDVLVTSSLEKSFPKNLLVAKISSIEKNDQKPFQQAQVDLFFNIKTADNLFVITNYKQTN